MSLLRATYLGRQFLLWIKHNKQICWSLTLWIEGFESVVTVMQLAITVLPSTGLPVIISSYEKTLIMTVS